MNLKSVVCILVVCFGFYTQAQPTNNRSFGINGQNGWPGANGIDGAAGPQISVQATGEFADYDIRGKNGTDGTPGTNGQHATNCVQPGKVPFHLYGAHGGSGGSGGDGGRGGDGGMATIFYQNEFDLKNIRIDAMGGLSGRPAPGGFSGQGCQCAEPTWLAYECWWETMPDGTMARRCEFLRYYCYNGRNGFNGYNGVSRGDGQWGSVALVQGQNSIQPSLTRADIRISQILTTQITLAYNKWSIQKGAQSLLAPSSRVSDNYEKFEGRKLFPVIFQWTAPRPLQDFASDMISLSLKQDQVRALLPENIWSDIRSTVDEYKNTIFTISKIVRESELFDLEVYFTGVNKNTLLIIKDHAGVSDSVNTTFNMHLEADTLFNKNLFKGPLPERFIKRFADRIEIEIGKMDIKDKYLNSGEALILDLTVQRSLGEKSKVQRYEYEQTLIP